MHKQIVNSSRGERVSVPERIPGLTPLFRPWRTSVHNTLYNIHKTTLERVVFVCTFIEYEKYYLNKYAKMVDKSRARVYNPLHIKYIGNLPLEEYPYE